ERRRRRAEVRQRQARGVRVVQVDAREGAARRGESRVSQRPVNGARRRTPGGGCPPGPPGGGKGSRYRALAREILAELVAIDTSAEGVGTTPAADVIVRWLQKAGYPASDIQLVGP